jgi:hypothetical protein
MALDLNDLEKKEIKDMMEKQMRFLSKCLTEQADILEATDEVDDDTEICWHEHECYMEVMMLGFHLYKPDITTYDAHSFWDNDTSVREGIWDALDTSLSAPLLKKVHDYIDRHNGPATGQAITPALS